MSFERSESRQNGRTELTWLTRYRGRFVMRSQRQSDLRSTDMFGQMDWLDAKLHPKLQLDGESIELAYQPVATDHGPGPLLVTFKARCIVRHHSGHLIYTVDDLTFMPRAFAEFSNALRKVLDGNAHE